MIYSLHAHQIERLLELGAWRDEGRLFAVGMNGEVFKYQDDKECQLGSRQRQGAAASAPPAPSPSPAASDSESAGKDGGKALKARYNEHLKRVREYYPSLISREVNDGLWVIVQSYPLGRDGPRFWICLFLPASAGNDPKGFAFSKLTPLVRPVGPRHTNFPDASICAFSTDDDAWRPGDEPLVLLNLYAEWLICSMFHKLAGFWPGKQSGLDAVYRKAEFKPEEWCFCDSGLRYGECHMESDGLAVEQLKAKDQLFSHGERRIPPAVARFARSHWAHIPLITELHLHPYSGLPPRHI